MCQAICKLFLDFENAIMKLSKGRNEVFMEENEVKLNDIADDLLIINKSTIENLFSLHDDNALVLYLFYYKTAKWQKTNQIFANDSYIRKCLNWGSNKVTNAKNTLKEAGLIEIIQKRENNKISGWYIKIKYFDNSKNTQKQELQNASSCNQETNALKEYIKCLENKIEMLTKENTKKVVDDKILEQEFEKLWLIYPKKQGKKKALEYFIKARKKGVDMNVIAQGLSNYNNYIKTTNKSQQYIKNGSTWFNQECWTDDYTVEKDLKNKSIHDMLMDLREEEEHE